MFAILFWPKTIHKSLPAFLYHRGEERFENTNINIEGKLYQNVFNQNKKFQGSITIDGFDYTKNYSLADLIPKKPIEEEKQQY
ncbi:MAG TPA: hypothetical protein GXZ28_09620 [Clostridiales bacterium]|nr:hypothetical protein [Clostridiales bacterium]